MNEQTVLGTAKIDLEKAIGTSRIMEGTIMTAKMVGFKRGNFAGTKTIYRKTPAGTFEAHIPHIGIVDSHHTEPNKFGNWLRKTYRRVK